MNLKNQVYMMRKRIKDKDLLKIKEIVDLEIERRTLNDQIQVYIDGN